MALSPVVAPGEVARDVAPEAVLDGGTNEFVAALAGVKPKPKLLPAGFVGVVPKGVKMSLAGESAAALDFGAPKSPVNDDFDGLGAVMLTGGASLCAPNLIGLSAFQVWSPFGLSSVLSGSGAVVEGSFPNAFWLGVDEGNFPKRP